MEEEIKNLSINNDLNNITPGSIVLVKNSSIEYVILGYDQYRINVICVVNNDNYQSSNYYVFSINEIVKILKYNKLVNNNNHNIFKYN